MTTTKTCRTCDEALIPGKNWSDGQIRARSYLCRKCNSEKGKRHYKRHAERAAKLQRERLKKKAPAKLASEYRSAYYARNKDKWKSYRRTQKEKEYSIAWHRAGRVLTWVRARAARAGFAFDLDRDWVEERLKRGRCETTGIEFEINKSDGRFHPWAPSIDRVDSKKGYTKDNCRIVVWIYNMAKSEWEDADVLKMAQALLDHHK